MGRHCWTEIAQKSWCPHAQVGDRPDVENLKTPRHHQKPKLGILEAEKWSHPWNVNQRSCFFLDKVDDQNKGINHLWQKSVA